MSEFRRPENPKPIATIADLVRIMAAGFRRGAEWMAREQGYVVDDAKIRRFIIEAFTESLREDGHLYDRNDSGEGPDLVPTLAGGFRMALIACGLDPEDQFDQERGLSVVEKALADALAED